VLGGSSLSPGVQAAMDAANAAFVPMDQLLAASGRAVAQMVGAEHAYITSGAFAALVLGIAGIMTGSDPARIERMPDTSGWRNEFLIQKRMRYHYDRCVTAAGGKLVEVGDERGTTVAQLEAAINPHTAGILYYAHMEGEPGLLTIPEVVAVAQRRGVRVILDAAGEVYPLQRMTSLPGCGADLICYGAKYLGSANSSGILCGKRDLVEAASLNGFVAYEAQKNRAMGRGFKIDRQEIVGTVVALREWLAMDHEERLQQQADRIQTITDGLAGLPHVAASNTWEEETFAWMRLRIRLSPALGKTAQQVADELRAGDPSVWIRVEGDDLFVVVHTLREEEVTIVRDRLAAALATR
jgi:L-seryl-tRNA(Ser) seleniumtransferase